MNVPKDIEQAAGELTRLSLADPAQDIIYGQPMVECDKNGLIRRVAKALLAERKRTWERAIDVAHSFTEGEIVDQLEAEAKNECDIRKQSTTDGK